MPRYKLIIEYDGTPFAGWQMQANAPSVQERMRDAIAAFCGEPYIPRGAGRTDSGVHALGQVASFHVETRLADERLLFALNAHLAEGVRAIALESCRQDFHAQKHARGKRYAYLVRTTQFPSPFAREHGHWVRDPLDLCAMRQAARHLVGEHDFTSLASSGSPRSSNVRRIHSVHVVARRERFAIFVQGDGFLYNMVRTIAGTLLEVGRGERSSQAIPALLDVRDRREAGPTAPPGGLYLLRVLYAEPCFLRRVHGPRGRPGFFQG